MVAPKCPSRAAVSRLKVLVDVAPVVPVPPQLRAHPLCLRARGHPVPRMLQVAPVLPSALILPPVRRQVGVLIARMLLVDRSVVRGQTAQADLRALPSQKEEPALPVRRG